MLIRLAIMEIWPVLLGVRCVWMPPNLYDLGLWHCYRSGWRSQPPGQGSKVVDLSKNIKHVLQVFLRLPNFTSQHKGICKIWSGLQNHRFRMAFTAWGRSFSEFSKTTKKWIKLNWNDLVFNCYFHINNYLLGLCMP